MKHAHAMPFGAELRDDGVAFRLWAPSREPASVVVDGVEYALERHAGGWFERVVPGVDAGARYAFAFRGLDLRVPDPASRFQPHGVHAPSMVIDPRGYGWRETAWRGRPWHEMVLYELHVGTFTEGGTYASAAERLDDLVRLGVTAVELMPLAQPAGTRNWGYDGALPFAPQCAYGTPDELKAFVDAAHARGLCVFLDVVYNHFGPEGNYLNVYAADVFTDRHHTPWGSAINVDGEGAQTVREFFVQNALYWLNEYRFDGLRFDAVHEIRDDSPRPFLDELAARVRAGVEPGRHVHLVLENDANQARLLSAYDAQWNDDEHHALHVLATGETDGYYRDYAHEPARHLARALAEGFAYQGEPSAHRGGAPRGEPSASLPSTAFVGFLQNHDQIGNRAYGERITALAPADAVRAATAIVLLAPQIPLLFMGEEWAASTPFLFFADFGAELAAAVTEGRRKEFAAWPAFADPATRERIPDPQAAETMRASTLRWNERTYPWHAEMLRLHEHLLAIRARIIVPHLASGVHGDGYEMLGGTAFRVRWRFGDGTRLTLVTNLGEQPARISPAAGGEVIYRFDAAEPGDGTLGPWSVAWFLEP
ncbi:MAG TPA: malto-oligosyltrehalose trehalohydrolase [Candidatus Elarobacter sp.]|jgi:maltooligosyltrehalose trehalohydrolase|nr:malto-oligosyltrehalose trehalohydrolase [Candidatus Elarobacter sp.]